MVMMTEEWYNVVKILLYSQAQITQTEDIIMMTSEGSTKVVNMMTPGAGIIGLARGQIRYIVKRHYFSLHSGIYNKN